MNILVISDLHIGKKARSEDLRPVPPYDDCLEKDFKNDFIKFVSTENIQADYLIVTGDISNEGAYDEFKLGKEVITDFAKKLSIDLNKVMIIPGNHDVDWKVLQLSTSITDRHFRRTQKYDPFENNFSEKITQPLVTEPYFTSWSFDDLYVIGFNSAWHDEHDMYVHHGLITNNIIEKIEAEINSKDLSQKVKLFITHHHLHSLSDPNNIITHKDINYKRIDHSIMVNSEDILRVLANNNFDMIIHGHKHYPRIFTQEINSIYPLAFLCAGSFSVLLEQQLLEHTLNMFHVVSFEGRDDQTNFIYGHVNNYSYTTCEKWQESKKAKSGLISQQGFGVYANKKTLKEKLIPLVEDLIKEKGNATWTDLCSHNDKLKYLTREFIENLTDEIAKDLKLEKHSIEKEILFIKKG